MASLLVQVTVGPEEQTKAALAFLIASKALQQGHKVTVFLVGEAVRLFDPVFLENINGLGTGKLQDHYQAIVNAGGAFFLSKLSSVARGYDETWLADKPAEYAMPEKLAALIMTSDKTVVY